MDALCVITGDCRGGNVEHHVVIILVYLAHGKFAAFLCRSGLQAATCHKHGYGIVLDIALGVVEAASRNSGCKHLVVGVVHIVIEREAVFGLEDVAVFYSLEIAGIEQAGNDIALEFGFPLGEHLLLVEDVFLFEPRIGAQLVEKPFHSLASFRFADVGLSLAIVEALAHLLKLQAADISHHMTDVADVLLVHGVIHIHDIVVVLATLHGPCFEAVHHYFEVGESHVAGTHVVVGEVFGLVGGVDDAEHLLCAKFKHRVAVFLANPLVESGLFVLHGFGTGDETVSPTDGVDIIHTEVGRSETHAALIVARLRYKVVASIVHDARGGAIFLCELRVAQVFDCECVACAHVVHQAESVPHFVGGDIG